jgi:transcription elongation GreA/GreB family factor
LEQKKQLVNKILEMLQEQIDSTMKDIADIASSRDSDTKSSAGDKYETGRAMLQQELDKCHTRLDILQRQKKEIEKVSQQSASAVIRQGSLVITNKGNYFISAGLGSISDGNHTYYCISLASPIGTALQGSKKDDTITFREQKFKILEVM